MGDVSVRGREIIIALSTAVKDARLSGAVSNATGGTVFFGAMICY